MANGVARKGDGLDNGISIIDGPSSNNVLVNGKKAALKGDNTSPDVGKLNGTRNVYVNNKSIQAKNDSTDLGSIITESSTNVLTI